jgi:superfamily I DNA/RNA helicase
MEPPDRWPTMTAKWAALYDDWKARNGLADFTDLLSSAADSVPVCPGEPDDLLIDEAQDCSALMLSLLRKWGRRAGRLVIIGDPHQSLYGWAGAHPEMFHHPMFDAGGSGRRTVLSQSWRVPAAVHRAAVSWMRGNLKIQPPPFNYFPREGEPGFVVRCGPGAEAVVRAAEQWLARGKTVMIQTTAAYFLQPIIAVLKQAGMPFENRWRRRNGYWNPLYASRGQSLSARLNALAGPIDPALGDSESSTPRLWTKREVASWAIPLTGLRRGAKPILESWKADDAPANFAEVVGLFPDSLLGEPSIAETLIGLIESRPADPLAQWWLGRLEQTKVRYHRRIVERRGWRAVVAPPRCYVGTVHSFKGAEADVTIIVPSLSAAAMRAWQTSGDDHDEIVRVGYVALTRAREGVILVASQGPSLPLGRCVAAP